MTMTTHDMRNPASADAMLDAYPLDLDALPPQTSEDDILGMLERDYYDQEVDTCAGIVDDAERDAFLTLAHAAEVIYRHWQRRRLLDGARQSPRQQLNAAIDILYACPTSGQHVAAMRILRIVELLYGDLMDAVHQHQHTTAYNEVDALIDVQRISTHANHD